MSSRKTTTASADGPVLVWDLFVRLFHWALVAAVATAWLSGEGTLRLHETAGYLALGLIALRVVWGWTGPHFARFAQFVRGPAVVWRYASTVVQHTDTRYLGHNPLGGWMVVGLMLGVASVCVTGWLYTLDLFWGLAWLEWLHRTLAWLVIALIAAHIAGVIFTSARHRENLVISMITGRKRGNSAVDSSRDSGV